VSGQGAAGRGLARARRRGRGQGWLRRSLVCWILKGTAQRSNKGHSRLANAFPRPNLPLAGPPPRLPTDDHAYEARKEREREEEEDRRGAAAAVSHKEFMYI
jgi:hypothetical protein